MGRIDISIIVPIYNTERYLRDCLDSILEEDKVSIEVICINDASTDQSGEIASEYQKKDSRIILINNLTNEGLSRTRNKGIDIARGKYIWFVDSDDYVLKSSISDLVNEMEKSSLDCILFDCECIYENNKLKEQTKGYKGKRNNEYPGVWTGRDISVRMLKNGDFNVLVQRQCWRLDYLLKNHLSFYPGLKFEDNLFSICAIPLTERVKCINKEYYVYRRREGSITAVNDCVERFRCFSIVYAEIDDFWMKKDIDDELIMGVAFFQSGIRKEIIKAYTDMISIKANVDDNLWTDRYNFVSKKKLYVGRVSILRIFEFVKKMNDTENLIVYGAGTIARDVIDVLKILQIDNYRVSVTKKNRNMICGSIIHEIDEIASESNLVFIVATAEAYHDEIKEELKSRGFHKILFAV